MVFLTGKERFAECRMFVSEHKLFSQALRLYSPDSEEFAVNIYG